MHIASPMSSTTVACRCLFLCERPCERHKGKGRVYVQQPLFLLLLLSAVHHRLGLSIMIMKCGRMGAKQERWLGGPQANGVQWWFKLRSLFSLSLFNYSSITSATQTKKNAFLLITWWFGAPRRPPRPPSRLTGWPRPCSPSTPRRSRCWQSASKIAERRSCTTWSV